MRIGIDASVLLKERSGVGQYVYRLHPMGWALSTRGTNTGFVCDSFGRANSAAGRAFPYRDISYIDEYLRAIEAS